MATARRLPFTTTVVGAWAVMIGVALLVLAKRLVTAVPDLEGAPSGVVHGGVSVETVRGLFTGLHDGGALIVVLGMLLVFAGWYRLLSRSSV